jgi:predicted permease
MSWIRGLAHRTRELLRPSRVDDELAEELRDHIDREALRLAERGASPIEALRMARVAAGSPDLARERVRDERTGRLLADTGRDVRVALRGMRRNPGFTAAVILSLGLGIGGTSAIFSVVDAVLIRPLTYPGSDRLYMVRVWWKDFSATLSPADLEALREQNGDLGEVAAYFLPDSGFAMATREGPELVDGGYVTANLPHVLGVPPVLGRGFTGGRGAAEVLIGEALWQQRFGRSPGVLGRGLTLDGQSYAIVGVMPKGFGLPGQRDGVVWPAYTPQQPTRRGPFFLETVTRLAPSVSPAAAQARLTSAVTPVMRDRYGVKEAWHYGLQPLKDVLIGDIRETLLLTFGAVLLVLLIAIANMTNLLLARATVRARELAVRASLGAARGRLARQLLVESALLGAGGGMLGLLLAQAIVRWGRTVAIDLTPRMAEVHVGARVAVFACVAGVAAGLVAGVVPVIRLPWARLGVWLRDGGRSTSEGATHGHVRRALVVFEIALTLTVLSGAALLLKTLMRLEQVDPGFRSEGVLSFRLSLPDDPYREPARVAPLLATLESSIRGVPGVTTMGFAMSLPPDLLVMTNNYTVEAAVPGHAGPSGVAEWNVVTPDYFSTMGIRLLAGRPFMASDRDSAPKVAVVNEAFVRQHFPRGDALGKRLQNGDWDPGAPLTTIVGIASDVPYERGVWGGTGPMVYTAYAQNLWLQAPYVVVKADGDAARLLPEIRRVVAAADNRLPVRDPSSMHERLHRSTTRPRLRGVLFSLLAGLALALAVTGIYGVMAYHVTQRRRETAIRRALGASARRVVRDTLNAGVKLMAIGIVLGTAGALVMTKTLRALLFQVDPYDPAVLAGAVGLLGVVAALACAIPAVRAARIDPALVLRDE